MRRIRLVLGLGAAVLGPATLAGQSGPAAECSVRVEGDVAEPVTIGAEQLRALPHREIQAAVHGQDTAQYAGVRLAEVLRLAGVRLGPGRKGAGVAQYVVVRAADGYRAVYAVAELDSAMTDREVWFVDRKNGGALEASEGPCRILVLTDRRHARSVRQVTTIEFHQVP
jgi:DMSO/TMAO reductase YedYZ molybdopterin-dependent catalytic subunit